MCVYVITLEHIIIIIINLYGAYILRNLSSEAQLNRIIKHNREQGRAKVSIRTRDNRTFMVEMQFGIDNYSIIRIIKHVRATLWCWAILTRHFKSINT